MCPARLRVFVYSRLRQVDVKAEHFERQVQRAEQERDAWEQKYEVREPARHRLADPIFTPHSRRLWKPSTRSRSRSYEELEKSMSDL